jgi:hypothetical protein
MSYVSGMAFYFFLPLGLHTGQPEIASLHFLHPIAPLIDYALGSVLAYLRPLDWVLTR